MLRERMISKVLGLASGWLSNVVGFNVEYRGKGEGQRVGLNIEVGGVRGGGRKGARNVGSTNG